MWSRARTGLKALLALVLIGAVVRHVAALAGFIPAIDPPIRHLAWIGINLLLLYGFLTDARWLALALLPVTAQQLTSHGMSVWRWVAGVAPFDGISLVVVIALGLGWWLLLARPKGNS